METASVQRAADYADLQAKLTVKERGMATLSSQLTEVINRLHGSHFVVDGLENILVFDRQRHDWLDKPSDEADIIAHSLRLSQNNEYT